MARSVEWLNVMCNYPSLSFQIQNHGRQLLRQTLDKYYAVGESSDAVTLAWNFFMAEVKYLFELYDQSSLC